MDIGRVLKDSWAIFVKDWAALIVGALITFVLGAVTLGILFVPLSAGLYLMILRRMREGRPAEVGDVFGCFDRLGAYVVAYLLFLAFGLVVAAIVLPPFLLLVIGHSGARGLGFVLLGLALLGVAVVGAYLQTIWVYWTILMVDRRRAVIEALKESREIVSKSGFWMTLLVIVVVGVIVGVVNSAISTVTFGIGGVLVLLVTPWQFAAYAAMYFQAVGESGLLPSAFPGPTAAWQGGHPAAYGGLGGPGGPYPFGGQPQAGSYGPPPGYPPPPGYAPPGYAPPGYAPPGYAPPGPPAPQAPPWASAPTTPPPWVQTPVWGQAQMQPAPAPSQALAPSQAAASFQEAASSEAAPEAADSAAPEGDAAVQPAPGTPTPPTPPKPPAPPS